MKLRDRVELLQTENKRLEILSIQLAANLKYVEDKAEKDKILMLTEIETLKANLDANSEIFKMYNSLIKPINA